MYLNTHHQNQRTAPGVFGGAMCTCKDCQESYWNDKPKEKIQVLEIVPKEKEDVRLK
jgi:hypothetical protein